MAAEDNVWDVVGKGIDVAGGVADANGVVVGERGGRLVGVVGVAGEASGMDGVSAGCGSGAPPRTSAKVSGSATIPMT